MALAVRSKRLLPVSPPEDRPDWHELPVPLPWDRTIEIPIDVYWDLVAAKQTLREAGDPAAAVREQLLAALDDLRARIERL
jgi:hypothetical protein